MNKISNSIYEYYLSHLDELPFDNAFHFASRLHLWSQDAELARVLEQYRVEFTRNNNPEQAIADIIARAKASPVHGSKNAAELRRPYFERYPMLKTYVTVLFRLTFLQTIYNIDARQLFFAHFPQNEVELLVTQLQQDYKALAVLSTHAINFLYLYERIIKQDDTSLSPKQFLKVGQTQYNIADPVQLQLLIYLYTHCIIGESQFYYRALPNQFLAIYQQMLAQLEPIITNQFTDINLDNKFEFLVACQLANYATKLAPKVWEEAAASISPDGTFIVDKYNNNPQQANAGFAKSEHRNVLCIMADRTFTPISS